MPRRRMLAPLFAAGLSLGVSLAAGEWLWRAAVRAAYEHALDAFEHWLLVADREHGCHYALRPDVDCDQVVRGPGGATTTWHCRTNADRMRHHEVWPPPADDTPRVLFLGDSYSFGYAVDDGVAFPHECERMLRRQGTPIFAINAGVPGYNSEQELARLRELLPRHRPRLVVLGFLGNDAEPVSYVPLPPARTHGACWLFEDGKGLINGLGVLLVDDRPLLVPRLPDYTLEYNDSFAPGSPKAAACFAAIAAMRDECERAGVPFLVAVLPLVANPFGDLYPFDPVHEAVATFTGAEGIATVDLLAAMRDQDSSGLGVPGDGHPNVEGHRRIAAALVPSIAEALR